MTPKQARSLFLLWCPRSHWPYRIERLQRLEHPKVSAVLWTICRTREHGAEFRTIEWKLKVIIKSSLNSAEPAMHISLLACHTHDIHHTAPILTCSREWLFFYLPYSLSYLPLSDISVTDKQWHVVFVYYPLGTLRPIYRTGVKLPSRFPILYLFNKYPY